MSWRRAVTRATVVGSGTPLCSQLGLVPDGPAHPGAPGNRHEEASPGLGPRRRQAGRLGLGGGSPRVGGRTASQAWARF